MLAGVLQMLALGCVLFGLINLAEPMVFGQWVGGAIFCQLLVMTLLLSHNRA